MSEKFDPPVLNTEGWPFALVCAAHATEVVQMAERSDWQGWFESIVEEGLSPEDVITEINLEEAGFGDELYEALGALYYAVTCEARHRYLVNIGERMKYLESGLRTGWHDYEDEGEVMQARHKWVEEHCHYGIAQVRAAIMRSLPTWRVRNILTSDELIEAAKIALERNLFDPVEAA